MLPEEKVESLVLLLREIEQAYVPAALASSFSAEDMLLTDLILKHRQVTGLPFSTMSTTIHY